MKKTIKGFRYDTEKAIKIGFFKGGNGINFVNEALYVTPRVPKRYFLAGTGGANTKFRNNITSEKWEGTEKIIPLSKKDAVEWAVFYMKPSVFDKHFGDFLIDPDKF